MALDATNFQCPSCTAPLRYSGKDDLLVCDYCGSSYTVHEAEALHREAEQEAAEKAEAAVLEHPHEEWGEDGVDAYTCPSCGAELICEDTTAAMACPYCGNPSIVPGRLHGVLKPDCVLPFRITKEQAVEALTRHCKKKFFLPKVFKDQNHIQQIKGIYVPFWLYDAKASGNMVFHATRVRSFRQGQYEVTETHHYNVHRAGTVDFVNVPADGSSKMPDDYMDSLEPFDFSQLVPFSSAYMPGFLADRYDVSAQDCAQRSQRRCTQTTKDLLNRDVVGYTTAVPIQQDIRVTEGKVHYAMLPVWLLYTKWQEQDFLFAINGQTGKIVGNLPVDQKKRLLTFLGIWLGSTAVLTALGVAGHLGQFLYQMFR